MVQLNNERLCNRSGFYFLKVKTFICTTYTYIGMKNFTYVNNCESSVKGWLIHKILKNIIQPYGGNILMVNKILNRIPGTKNLTELMKIIYLYRYFSLIITSFFYIIGNLQTPLIHKLIIVTCLSISSIILNHLYVKSCSMKNIIRMLVVIETLGNVVILIPSGGLNSPYILYSLNTILVTLYYLDLFYCLADLLIYLVFSTGVSILIFNQKEGNIVSIMWKNSNLIISFVLIIVVTQLLFNLAKKLNKESGNLSKANNELIQANKRINESVEHIMSLYQAINSIANINNREKLTSLIIYYTREITKAPLAFFYMGLNEQKMIETSENVSNDYKKILMSGMDKQWRYIKASEVPISINIDERTFILINVKSIQQFYGILGIETNNQSQDIMYVEIIDQLKFLSSLSSIVFERFKLEEVNEHLLVSEEQNRIAREIHDSVCQRIFAISCIIHTLKQKSFSIPMEELNKELDFVKDSLNKANKELRMTIYNLSWKNKQSTAFQEDIESYINEITRLNDIIVDFNITGNQELLSCDLKKTIYRIICEGAGNAIRHGRCNEISIHINIQKEKVKLFISDNGKGFNMESKLNYKGMGLGINNIHNLVYYLNGEVNIDSQLGNGTSINILLPNNMVGRKIKGEVV